jgi:hypothetical protein
MKEWTQNVGKGAPLMWDDYSGEPTFDGAGKPSQVKPGEFDYRAGLKPANKMQQPLVAMDNAHKAGFREKATRLAQRGLAVDTRPPWKGSSGRQAIVGTPQDKPGQPVPQPRRQDEKRVKSPGNMSSNNAASPSAHIVALSPETRQVTASARPEKRISSKKDHDASSGRQIYNSVPADSSSGATLHQQPTLRKGDFRPAYASDDSPPPRRTRNSPNSRFVEDSPGQNPNSRFSWTTTATSMYQRDSPPPSPPPPMPTKYLNEASPSPQASMLERGHPTRRLGVDEPSPPMSSGRSFSAGSTLRKPISSAFAVRTLVTLN